MKKNAKAKIASLFQTKQNHDLESVTKKNKKKSKKKSLLFKTKIGIEGLFICQFK